MLTEEDLKAIREIVRKEVREVILDLLHTIKAIADRQAELSKATQQKK
jgi:hypothetical protein